MNVPEAAPEPAELPAALAQIHAARLYRAIGYTTFGDYAEQHCGISRTEAYRLVQAA
ncbi:hypothetical protein ACFWBC_10425 [Streptomyces sp. NPDC059985]|uniref:hypothetical protein n=1 Tax=Streptomyces sp. NPDC059985 TaxID=3347025 RepID=UPI003683F435